MIKFQSNVENIQNILNETGIKMLPLPTKINTALISKSAIK